MAMWTEAGVSSQVIYFAHVSFLAELHEQLSKESGNNMKIARW